MEETEWAYIAGFFDGEGHVGCRAEGIYLTFTQRDPTPLLWIKSKLTIGYISQQKSGVHRYRIVGGKTRLRQIILCLLPYTIVKKAQLEIALEYMATFNHTGGWSLTQDELEERRRIRQRILDIRSASRSQNVR